MDINIFIITVGILIFGLVIGCLICYKISYIIGKKHGFKEFETKASQEFFEKLKSSNKIEKKINDKYEKDKNNWNERINNWMHKTSANK